jgi:hypothetical protein
MAKVLAAAAVTALAVLTTAPVAYADHNSPWGEGWANMPNDIHNTRLDTRDDNETFIDFVRQGAGAESVNRFSDAIDVRPVAPGGPRR